MSSLFDRYYSDINKNYIFDIACKIIKDEYNIDVSQDKYFNDIYITNLDEAFKNTDTDNITLLNRNLLYLQINSYKSHNQKNNINDNKISLILNGANRIIEDNDSIYNFKIISPSGDYTLNNLIIPEENNILFSNPLIIVTINDSDIYLKLLSSYNLNSRTFLEYVPIDKQEIVLKNTTEVIIKNSLNTSVEKNGLMSISKVHEDYIEVPDNIYKSGDSIKINNEIFNIKNILNNKDVFLDNIKEYELKVDDKILNISESPILIFKITN